MGETSGELVVVVVEDEPDVRAAIVRDLAPLTSGVRIDEADAVDDARAALVEAAETGDHVGLILADHRLPGESGVDLLVSVNADADLRQIRTVLITGQAGHQDTIRAINQAGLDWYFAKPWDPDELTSVVVRLLTDYVIDVGLDPLRFVSILDSQRLLEEYGRHVSPD